MVNTDGMMISGLADISCGRPKVSRVEPSFLPNFLSRIGLAFSVPVFSISDAVHCNRSRSALQPPLQCTASVLAVHCNLHANTCLSIETNRKPDVRLRGHRAWRLVYPESVISVMMITAFILVQISFRYESAIECHCNRRTGIQMTIKDACKRITV